MEIEQQLIEYVAKTLVDKPDDVRVERIVDDRGILLTLHVDDDDLGRVIGKGGVTAQSLRLILKALGSKNDERYNLRIADGQPRPEPGERSRPAAEPKADDQPAAQSPAAEPATDEPKADDGPVVNEPVADEPEAPDQSEVEKAKNELASLDDLDI